MVRRSSQKDTEFMKITLLILYLKPWVYWNCLGISWHLDFTCFQPAHWHNLCRTAVHLLISQKCPAMVHRGSITNIGPWEKEEKTKEDMVIIWSLYNQYLVITWSLYGHYRIDMAKLSQQVYLSVTQSNKEYKQQFECFWPSACYHIYQEIRVLYLPISCHVTGG